VGTGVDKDGWKLSGEAGVTWTSNQAWSASTLDQCSESGKVVLTPTEWDDLKHTTKGACVSVAVVSTPFDSRTFVEDGDVLVNGDWAQSLAGMGGQENNEAAHLTVTPELTDCFADY
jgi:hypothetical protein